MTPDGLFTRGVDRLKLFCAVNTIELPAIERVEPDRWRFSVCAYYRPSTIKICVSRCARPGTSGRSWSWPGYSTDRTPYGALAHELAHHVDYHATEEGRGAYWSAFGTSIRRATGEPPLTGYCANDAEWFAEMFRLFITNADLLRVLRPQTWYALMKAKFRPVSADSWEDVIHDAPPRYRTAIANKINNVPRSQRQETLL